MDANPLFTVLTALYVQCLVLCYVNIYVYVYEFVFVSAQHLFAVQYFHFIFALN